MYAVYLIQRVSDVGEKGEGHKKTHLSNGYARTEAYLSSFSWVCKSGKASVSIGMEASQENHSCRKED